VENFLDGVRNVTAPVVGAKVAPYAFPLLIGFFSYILIQNWSSLLPGVGTVMFKPGTGDEWSWVPFVRAGNADLNGTVALAIVGITAWLYFILRFAGPKLILKDIFGNKATKGEVHPAMYYSLFVVFFVIGFIELVSMMIRPVSLSLRLYGNAFGGEYVIHTMSAITRWGLPIPFYFLEFLVGLIQALVFTLLISVYIGLICNHDSGDHKDHADDKAAH
jgi:F-type H+-transporting ATPase subunit a